jgi:predicted XRE-type DNA-binding protein
VAVQLGKKIYVLHAFQKKSRRGIATPRHEIDLISRGTQKQGSLQEMSDNDQTRIEMEESSGNVFADLDLEDADELFARAQLGFHVYKILKDKKLKQREITKLLGIAQPDVSHLMNGHFSRFTMEKLLNFLRRLDQKVTIQISPHRPEEPYQEIGITS